MIRDLSRADLYDLARVARDIERTARPGPNTALNSYSLREGVECEVQIGKVPERIGVGDVVAVRARGSLRVGHVVKLYRTRLLVAYVLSSGGRRESIVNRLELVGHQATPAVVER